MTNRILRIDLLDRSLVPAEAEVHVTVFPGFLDAGTEVRGRLTGPRCHFASTVEVAYHLRRVLLPTAEPALSFKVIIPEASLWEPESPHLYAGPIELWQNGVRCEVVPVRHGLRYLSLGPRGLRLNGRQISLHGAEVSTLNDAEGLALRQAGYNLVLVPVDEESRHVWDAADRLGFLVIGRVSRDKATLTAVLARHPCCLGWLWMEDGPIADLGDATLLGVEQGRAFPPEANFLAVPGSAALPGENGPPVLLLGVRGEARETAENGPVVLGVVDG
jgi:hypothetical protein